MKEELLSIIPKDMPYRGDSVIFFERSNSLYSEGAASNFREFLIENKIRHNVILNIDQLTDDQLREVVCGCLDSVLCFETTGTYHELNDKIAHIIISLSNKGYRFTILECYAYEPKYYGIPQEANEENIKLYSLDSYSEDIEDWELTKREKR